MIRLLSLSIALLVGFHSHAETRAYGYLKNYSLIQNSLDVGPFTVERLYSSQFSGRAMLDMLEDSFAVQIHYEAGRDFNSDRLNTNSVGFGLQLPSRNTYRWTDITPTLGDENNKSVTRQNLDRFNVQWNLAAGDLTLGRQAITFGSARIINPTDVFLPFDVQTLNTEYRVGIDAVRFQRPLGQLSEIDTGIVLGDKGTADSAAFIRFKSSLQGNDIELSMIRFSEQTLIGAGVERSLGPFGSWLEVAGVNGDQDYVRASLGLDYGFSEHWFGMLEYHYNGAGTDDTAEYLVQLSTRPYTAGGVFLLGEHYLIPSLSWQISPLTTASLQLLVNLDDQSAFTNATLDFSVSDNLYLGLSLFAFSGEQPDLLPTPALNSEYGSNAHRLIVSLRYYF